MFSPFFRISKILSRLALVGLVLLVSACGNSLTKKTDETANWSAEQLFHAAEVQMKQKNYSDAVGFLEKLEGRFPYGRYVQQAQLDIAYAYFRDGQNDLALAAIERFIHLHPAHPSVDYAYYLKGLISFNIKRGTLDFLLPQRDYGDRNPEAMKKAYNAFRDLVDRFPDSRYAVDARKRMVYLHNLLAKHEIYVAQHYFVRGAYVAAVNRAKYVIENYQRTPAVEDALGIQVNAYAKLGMPRLAKDAERVLRLNFPKSDYLKNLPKELATDETPASESGQVGSREG